MKFFRCSEVRMLKNRFCYTAPMLRPGHCSGAQLSRDSPPESASRMYPLYRMDRRQNPMLSWLRRRLIWLGQLFSRTAHENPNCFRASQSACDPLVPNLFVITTDELRSSVVITKRLGTRGSQALCEARKQFGFS